MRVLQVNASYGLGSTGKIVEDISDFLISKGDECLVFCAESTVKTDDIYIVPKIYQKINLIKSVISGMQGFNSYGQTKKLLLGFLKDNKPDIIHLHNCHNNYVNVEFLFDYAKANRIPVIITLHDCWFFTGKCCHYVFNNCKKWSQSCGNCPRVHKDNKSLLFDRSRKMLSLKKSLYSNCDSLTVIGVSDWIAYEAKQSIMSNSANIRRIYNWVDTKLFSYIDKRTTKKKYSLVAISSIWDETKGIDDIYRLADFLDDRFEIRLIGRKPKRLKSGITYLGLMQAHETAKEIQNSDIVFSMSQGESFGLTLAEAISCGKKVVAYDNTALGEMARLCGGAAVSNKNVLEFANCIKSSILDNDENVRENNLGDKLFNKDNNINEYYSIYKEMLTKQSTYKDIFDY